MNIDHMLIGLMTLNGSATIDDSSLLAQRIPVRVCASTATHKHGSAHGE